MAELPRQCLFFAVALDECLIGRPFFSPEKSPGRASEAIGIAAYEQLVQRRHFNFDADAAAVFSRTAAIGAESVAFIEQRVI